MTGPRVAFLDHTAELGGGERSLMELVGPAQLFQPLVVLGADGLLVGELDRQEVEHVVAPLEASAGALGRGSGWRQGVRLVGASRRWPRAIEGVLEAWQPDVVVANSLKAGLAAALVTHRLRLPFLWSVRDRLTPDYLGAVARVVARTAVAFAPDLVVANSSATAATCPERTPVRIIPPSVSPIHLPEAVRSAGTQFAMVARLTPWKGQDLVIRAFARAFPEGDERLRLVGGALFGEVDYEAELRSLIDELALDRRVTMTGHVGDVARELADVDVLVHATRIPEPFGRSIVEAMSAGLPVIVEDIGGPGEIVTDAVDGLLIAPGDGEALVAAMVRLASDAGLRSRLGQAGREASRRYAPSVLEPEWLAAFEHTIELQRRRRR